MKTRFLFPLFLLTTFASFRSVADDTNGLLLNFHQVPLGAVLNYISDKAGLIVVSEAEIRGTVTVTARQPLTIAEAVSLLNDQLSENHYAAFLDGRTLTVMDAWRAVTSPMTPVDTATNLAAIPADNEMVTEILPTHSLNPAQLVRDLAPLIPSDDTVTANEAGSAVIMTACRKDVHRLAAMIAALDSTAVSEVNVFELQYADAPSVASELKGLFQSADSDASRASARTTFSPRFGRFPAEAGGDDKTKTAAVRPVFVADEQINAVAASAPPDVMPLVARVVALFDKPGQELTDVEIIPLENADPGEVVDELTSLFANSPTTPGRDAPVQMPGFPPRFAGLLQSTSRQPAQSNRLKRQGTVSAVADRRTQSVIVEAGANTMAQVRKIVARLDHGKQGVMRVSVFQLGLADAGIAQEAFTELFAGATSSARSQTPITTPIDAHYQAGATGQSSSTTTALGSGFGNVK